jgi:two-component system KDP operon response regulator KdpE
MSEKMHTLVVDDEAGIRFFLAETLRKAGHTVEVASSGEEALERLRTTPFDLVMLDLKLGGRVDGLRVLEAVRWRWPGTMAIILTGHGSLDSAMAAIRDGVDGYLLKPVEPKDLRRAIQEASDRRQRRSLSKARDEGRQVLRHGPFSVDLSKHLATLGSQPLDLTTREFRLLAHLIQNANRVVGPKELVHAVQGYECDSLYEARDIIKWYVHRLRHKVEPDPSNPRYITNVRGVGYRFGE